MKTSYTVVESKKELETIAGRFAKEPSLGVDLEADSMHHFQERVCLVQIASRSQTALIDPIGNPDLSALEPIFADHSIQKIFHGADYDVRSLYRDFSIEINNLFDTQLASMYLGIKETGLEAVLKTRFQLSINKKYQRKDWSQRPLPAEMIEYAAQDAMHLLPLAHIVQKELKALDRLGWVEEECRLLSRVRPAVNRQKPLFLNFKGAGRLERRQLAVLESLLQYRKTVAKRKDRPPFKIIGSRSLLALAKHPPASLEKIEALGALSPKQTKMYGRTILNRIRKAMEVPQANLPEYPRKKTAPLPPAASRRIQELKEWRRKKAEQLVIEGGLLFNKACLVSIALHNPVNIAGLSSVPGLKQWQCRAFGKEIMYVLEKSRNGKRGSKRHN